MFIECYSLISLPDISKWQTSKLGEVNQIIGGCYSLISLPNLTKWEKTKIKDICHNCLNALNGY